MSLDSYIAKQLSNPQGIGGRIASLIMNRQNRPLYKETIQILAPSGRDNILDIGCGNGYVLNMLAQQFNCSLVGIDPSESIIGVASRYCSQFVEEGRMTFMCQNVKSMSFANNTFEKAYTINTVYFWESLHAAMLEIGRVLKPGGLFINTLYSNETLSRFSHTKFGYKRFSLEQLTSAGVDAGFDINVMPILDGAAYCILYHKTKRKESKKR